MKKILLLHGWNYKNYTSLTTSKDAWNNRIEFINKLSKKYQVYKLNFPGFCGEKEPNRAWNLSDYANYVSEYLKQNNLEVDYILGYSFGGAVAIKYALEYNINQKLILISPAIIRDNKHKKKFIKTPIFLNKIRYYFRNLYLKRIIKNPYMIHGTKFLNDTYQNIVRVSLLDDILLINPNNLTIIYGEKDNMVNPNKVINTLNDNYKKRIFIIKDGTHDIANTNANDILNIINKYTYDEDEFINEKNYKAMKEHN